METSGRSKEYLPANRLFFVLNQFIALNLYPMNKEENQLLLVLWQHYAEQEILMGEESADKWVSPRVVVDESVWMKGSIAYTEIQHWLNGLKLSAPGNMYQAFLSFSIIDNPVKNSGITIGIRCVLKRHGA